MNFPLVEKDADRHKQDLGFGPVQLSNTIINHSGKQFFVCYPGGGRLPTSTFFSESSLSTYRFVPFIMASIMAFL